MAVADLDLVDLVANRTMSPQIGATLAAFAAERRSFLVCAVPRLAGKSTVMAAMLDCVPEGTPVRWLARHPDDVEQLPAQQPAGYLVVPEISQAPVPGYIWGEPVRSVFSLLARGYSLATALHAPGVDEAFEVLTRDNGVSDEQAARLELFVYIRSLGDDWRSPTRRVIAAVHEIDGVTDGRPHARLLHRWDKATDTFEQVTAARRLAADDLDARATDLLRATEGRSGGT